MLAAFSWISRSFILQPLFPSNRRHYNCNDIRGIAYLYLPNAKKKGEAVNTMERYLEICPGESSLLFGGGMALAKAFEVSGLADMVGRI